MGLGRLIKEQAPDTRILQKASVKKPLADEMVSFSERAQAITQALSLVIPVLYLGCLLWWDFIPETTRIQTLTELQYWEGRISSNSSGEITSIGTQIADGGAEGRKAVKQIADEIPAERTPQNIAMWVAGITLAFALCIATANRIRGE